MNKKHQDIINDYKNGKEINDIAEKYYLSAFTIKRILIKNKIPKRIIIKYNHNAIIKDYEEGIKLVDIEKKHNISESIIYNILKTHNITPNRIKGISNDT